MSNRKHDIRSRLIGWMVFSTCWLSTSCQAGEYLFGRADFTVGNSPIGIAAADLNGDQIMDFVVANSGSSSVSVMIGRAEGQFEPAVAYSTAFDSPVGIVVCDLNGDGIPDLAVGGGNLAAGGSGGFSILLGKGDGTFAPAVFTSLSVGCDWIAAADFNKDGRLDLVTANGNGGRGNTVSVILGNGDGTFRTPRTFVVGANPAHVVTADFNHDGIPDIATSNNSGDSVSILIEKGDGTFAPQLVYGTVALPIGLAAGDLDGDGKVDLVVASDSVNQVSVLLGNGDGTFKAASTATVYSAAHGVVIDDFNGDGIPDVATTGSNRAGAATISLVFGNGDGTFSSPRVLGSGYGCNTAVSGRFRNSALPDLAVTNYESNTVSVLLSGH